MAQLIAANFVIVVVLAQVSAWTYDGPEGVKLLY